VNRDIDHSSENVLADWRATEPAEDQEAQLEDGDPASEEGVWGTAVAETEVSDEPEVAEEPAPTEPEAPEPELPDTGSDEAIAVELSHEHAAGDLEIPDGYAVLEGDADGSRRAVGVVVARFNGAVTSRLLERALEALDTAGVRQEAITVMVVPGAFELPLAATALAKTRRFACIVALGCVIRGDTPHFDYVAGESASGLQLAALETGVPVSFGVLTLDRIEQAEARIEKGAEAVRTALEMADVFAHLRAAASR
jgi:6,7-dimethyl-8-ribityllumazine synthase